MADYITLDSKVDSKSLGNHSTYQPSTEKKLDVVFQPDSTTGYYSVLALNSNGGYDISNDNSTDISGNEEESEKPIYSIGSNPINGLFIGSVTVLGLFLLYRLLKK